MCSCLRYILAACAAVCLSMSGCGKQEKAPASSAAEKSPAPEASNSAAQTDPSADNTDQPAEENYELGDYLRRVDDIYSRGNYTLECVLTGSYIDNEIRITKAVRGDDWYQLQTESVGSYGTVSIDGECYDFDNACGMFRTGDAQPTANVVEEIKAARLSCSSSQKTVTDGSPDGEPAQYAVEEYTYAGDTYITTLEFYFDMDSGELVKYDTVYSVEGEDDIIETREMIRLDNEVDDALFDTEFISDYSDIGAMTADERQSFCQELRLRYGISDSEMYGLGITADDLSTINYDELFRLVYTCGEAE